METADQLLSQVVRKLAPSLAEVLAGRASQFLVWIDVDPATDRCVIRFMLPHDILQAERDGVLPRGEMDRVAGCHPALAMPILATGPCGSRRHSWLTVMHQPDLAQISKN